MGRHREVMAVAGKKPTIDDSCFIAPSATIMGSVAVGKKSSIWYRAVVKGDRNGVSIGSESVVKDLAMLTTANGKISIGNNVVVCAGACIDGATVEDGAVIGAAATLASGVVVGKGAYVAPGARVEAGTTVPAGKVSLRLLGAASSARTKLSSEFVGRTWRESDAHSAGFRR